MAWYIGLMSGTSLDGVDGVLAQDETGSARLQSRAHLHLDMPGVLRAELLALNSVGANEIHRAALAANALMRLYAQAVSELLARCDLASGAVAAIGAHGQTVRHRPGEFDGTGYSTQLINGALLAELTGIDVVCDFRSRDIAAGGQGAPLVPAFHAASFGRPGQHVAVLNIGGIANLSLLPAQAAVLGFDCGPGNVLMDLWCQRHLGQAFDAEGAWAAGGHVIESLLESWLRDRYFSLPPPKSTGRDLFNAAWLTPAVEAAPARDVMATLAELTAATAAQALQRHAGTTTELLVCGGGAHNTHLMRRLAARVGPQVPVRSTEVVGVAPDQVESLAFAWLASACMARRPGNLPAVTGARGLRVLGALYAGG